MFAAAAIEIAKDEVVSSLMNEGGQTNAAVRPAATPAKQRSWRIDSHFFTFDLQRCRLSGTSVLCDLIIINNERDRVLEIGRSRTRMYDDFGNEAVPREIVIADGTRRVPLLISGVRTKARVLFDRVSPQATRMTRFQLGCQSDTGYFEVIYRDVPLREQMSSEDLSENNDSQTIADARSNHQVTLEVRPGRRWIDSGLDVEPGMKLHVTVTGSLAATADNRSMSTVLSGVLNRRVNLPSSNITIGPKALLAKVRYRRGGESKALNVGEKNTLLVEANEFGRLYFGVDTRYSNSSGSFMVTLSW